MSWLSGCNRWQKSLRLPLRWAQWPLGPWKGRYTVGKAWRRTVRLISVPSVFSQLRHKPIALRGLGFGGGLGCCSQREEGFSSARRCRWWYPLFAGRQRWGLSRACILRGARCASGCPWRIRAGRIRCYPPKIGDRKWAHHGCGRAGIALAVVLGELPWTSFHPPTSAPGCLFGRINSTEAEWGGEEFGA